ncbi:hypothetical protein ACFQV8_05550 [Pseudonocardia benzenivorans]
MLGTLTLLTGVATPESWTADVFTAGFLLVPVLAATQLRAHVCAAVAGATVVVYLVAGVATQQANAEPWASLLLRTAIVAGVGLGCIGLSRIQRSRVETIGSLVTDRTDLLGQLTGIEERERRVLSEHLHDGALQYVLAARQDLEDARDTGDAGAFDRIEEALLESSRCCAAPSPSCTRPCSTGPASPPRSASSSRPRRRARGSRVRCRPTAGRPSAPRSTGCSTGRRASSSATWPRTRRRRRCG